MATRPLPEAAARSPEVDAGLFAPPPSAIAAAAESRRMPAPPPQSPPFEPKLFLSPAAEPLPDSAADAKPSPPRIVLHDLLLAIGAVVALAAVLVLADSSRKPAPNHHVDSLTTGTAYPPKPSAYGEFLEPQPAHHFRTPAPIQADFEPTPQDSAAPPDTSVQPAPGSSAAPAEPPQTDPSPDAQPTPAPPADPLTR